MSLDDYEEEKPWDLKDDFKYAPEKPEGDPWTLLGEPLMARDERLCKILRDEVNNLLLFAGLFSAVVTAFVVESYHDLQPDPNDDVILLLSQISESIIQSGTRLNQTSTNTSLPSVMFTPSQSAIRVNITWFTSLIFSLTSVLVSIVALQWLRSHQTYSGLSPRDTLAVLNMRSESLQKWQVATIIMSLPVLLEVSVLLFFAGMIDFLIALGNTPVVIAVALTIGLAILFLVVTTTLPTVQTIYLRFSGLHPHGSPGKRPPPSQCPYKSPQSLLFHHICSVIIQSARFARVWLGRTHRSFFQNFGLIREVLRPLSRRNPYNKALLYHLSAIYSQETWVGIDLAWLGVRDAAELGTDTSEPDLGELDRYSLTERSLPLYDIVQGFQKASGADYTHVFGSAVYHCFHELSYASVMTFAMKRFGLRIFRATDAWDVISQHILNRNQYFQSLLSAGRARSPRFRNHDIISSTGFINFEAPKFLHVLTSNVQILHHQNLLLHLESLNSNERYSKITLNHRKELMVRLGKALYQQDVLLQRQTLYLPPYLRGKIFEQGLSTLYADGVAVSLLHQYSYTLVDFFKHASTSNPTRINPRSLHVHTDVVEFLENSSWDMYRSITTFTLPRAASQDHLKIHNTFYRVVGCLIDLLKKSDADLGDHAERPSSNSVYLLYSSAIYARRLTALIQSGIVEAGPSFKLPDGVFSRMNALLQEIALYRTRLSINLKKDETAILLERKFRGMDRYGNVLRFSQEWWSFLDSDGQGVNRHIVRSSPTWYEDMFHDQLRRITATFSFITPIPNAQSNNGQPEDELPTHSGDAIGIGNYTLQILPALL